MCGISGLWLNSNQPITDDALRRLNRKLAHRGPDGSGTFIDGPIGLAHTRLSILDTSDHGAQPMSYGGGRYTITFNGEIYNFIELRRELEDRGHIFHSQTDTEVVLAAYAEWGEQCQDKFNGMWAFAIWDRDEQLLFLSRDRFGIKPLYFGQTNFGLVFASELKAFTALPQYNLEFDGNFLAYSILDQNAAETLDQTILSGIRKLLPGRQLVATSPENISIGRWWKMENHVAPSRLSEEEEVERLQATFLDACRIRMRSDVPIGTALSGGLDSSSVHGAVAQLGATEANSNRLQSNWQKAFHADFPNTIQSERNYVQDMVAMSGAQPIYLEIGLNDALSHLDDALYACETVSGCMVGQWLTYREMRNRGVVVSLDGHGADELYAGYHHHLVNLAQSETKGTQSGLYESMALEVGHQHTKMSSIPGLGKQPFLRIDLSPINPTETMDQCNEVIPDPRNRMLLDDFERGTLPPIIRNFDRCSMAHGVEIRMPFLDWRLVCEAYSMSFDLKVREGFTKWVLREACRDWLPESILKRKLKLGFSTPLRSWMGAEVASYVADIVSSQGFQQLQIWDGPKIKSKVDRHLVADGDARAIPWIWTFVEAYQVMNLFHQRQSETP